jgi:DNA primase
MISKNTIDKVFETTRIEEVIGDYVHLKKAGSNFKGLSPFSEEKTPSFMVSPVKQIWKDFSSGKGGNAISFLMEHEHYSYPEAIRFLAKKYNIEIEETEQTDEQKQQADERESMYLVSEFARDYFKEILWKSEKGKAIGLSYFKERNFSETIIEKFDLGYALDEWDVFTQKAISKGYKIEYLEKTGLTIVKENKQFDRFKGRIIFPIHSMSGRILGFGGRILSNEAKAAKYVNSPESIIYHKSKVLYGIYYAKQSIAKENNCYLVEGYTDVISLYQSGIHNVVASSGTALTPDQIRLINRLTPNITVLYDGDSAGIKASLRGIDLILEQGMNVKVVAFPEGEDPDSFAKQNSTEELQDYLDKNAKDFIRFKVSILMDEVKNDPVKKAELIRDIVVSIAKIPNNIQREIYVQECAKIMDISEKVLFSELAQLSKREIREASKRANDVKGSSFEVVKNKPYQFEKVDQLNRLEKKLIAILLLYGNNEVDFEDYVEVEDEDGTIKMVKEKYHNKVYKEIYLNLQEDEIEFSNETFLKIYYLVIDQLNQNDQLNSDDFINHTDLEISQVVTDILMDDEKYSLSDWERKEIYVKAKNKNLSKLVMDAIFNLRRILIELKIKELLQEQVEENDSQPMLEMVVNYTSLKKLLFEKLNRVV